MTTIYSLPIKKGLIVLISMVLAAWFIVGCITTQLAPAAPDPSTWHTVPVSVMHRTSVVYITPLEAGILRISHYGLGLAILLAGLVAEVRKQKKSLG